MRDFQFVNANGERLDLAKLAGKHKPAPKASTAMKRVFDRASAKASDGFIVTGFSPEHLANAEIERAKLIEYVNASNEAERQKQNPKFQRVPDLWNEDRYMLTAKPKRVRAKPYELAEAADVCAALAVKAGWKCVRVEELMKA